jgi:hypothetical protein
MIWAPGSIWKVFQLVRAIFEQFGVGPVTWGGEQNFALCCIPVLHYCIGSGGVCFGSGRACICAGEALCGVRALVWWFVLFA